MGSAKIVMGAVIAAAMAAPAFADEWSVVALEGLVKVSADGQWRELRAGEAVNHGAWLKTGTRGSVTVEREGTVIAVSPRSLVALASLADDPDMTVLAQRWGRTSLEVETRGEPHVAVQTPYLTAVVKGTTFDVEVDRRRAWLSVAEGRVEVEDMARGLSAAVADGQSARVSGGSSGSLRMSGPGDLASIAQVAPREPTLAPMGRRRALTAEEMTSGRLNALDSMVFGQLRGSSASGGGGRAGSGGAVPPLLASTAVLRPGSVPPVSLTSEPPVEGELEDEAEPDIVVLDDGTDGDTKGGSATGDDDADDDKDDEDDQGEDDDDQGEDEDD